jgi:hypothetical protein
MQCDLNPLRSSEIEIETSVLCVRTDYLSDLTTLRTWQQFPVLSSGVVYGRGVVSDRLEVMRFQPWDRRTSVAGFDSLQYWSVLNRSLCA